MGLLVARAAIVSIISSFNERLGERGSVILEHEIQPAASDLKSPVCIST